MSNQEVTPLVPREGWHVMHLFYHVDHAQWSIYSDEEKRQAKTHLTELVQEIRATPDTHLLIFSIATPKADLGFMLLTADLQVANAYEKISRCVSGVARISCTSWVRRVLAWRFSSSL